MAKPPWSNRQLRVLGTKVREGSSGYASDPSYDAVLSYFNGLAISAQTRLENLDWEPLLGTRIPEVTSRPKTIDALRQKLQRDPATPLQSVQDSVANAVAGMFEQSRAVAGRNMRYGGLPKDGASRQMASALHKLSTEIAGIENQRNLLDRRERELAEASGVAANAPRSPNDRMLKIEGERQQVIQQERSVFGVRGTLRTAFESMPRREGNNRCRVFSSSTTGVLVNGV